jgi:hypothetical protein
MCCKFYDIVRATCTKSCNWLLKNTVLGASMYHIDKVNVKGTRHFENLEG